MDKIGKGLGFRLIIASFLVVAVFITIAGLSVYKISQDAIKVGSMEVVRDMTVEVRRQLDKEASFPEITDTLMEEKTNRTGSVWIMDGEGYLLFHPDPVFRREYIERGKNIGNVVVSLQHASPRASGTGIHKEKLVNIVEKYEEGFGKYKQYGQERIIAFQVIKEKGWMIGLDAPVATAESELARIKRYIFYTALFSAVLIMAFTWLVIRIIIKPYYRELEDLNLRLQVSNQQLSESNEMLEASNKKLTALYKISIAMQETLSLRDILDMIISGAQEVLNVDRINVMLPDKEEAFLECRAAIGAGDRPLKDIKVPISSKGGALAAAFRRSQIIKVSAEDHLPPQFRLEPPYNQDDYLRSSAFVVMPMVVKNKTVGVIAIDNKFTKSSIVEETVNLLQIFTNQAAVAVENARLYEELKCNLEELDSKLDQLSIVNQISNTMQKMVNRKEMLGFILRGIKESMGFDTLMVCLVDSEENLVRGEIGINIPEGEITSFSIPLENDSNVVVAAINGRLPDSYYTIEKVTLPEVLAGTQKSHAIQESPGDYVDGSKLAMTIIPIMALDQVVGIMAAARTKLKPAILKREIELLLLFANTAGLAVERAGLYERLNEDIESLEITDHVTKLFTFKYGQQRLREELIKAKESPQPFSLVMIGIDKFKTFNDKCGQELGDRALKEIAAFLKESISMNDLAFRYGGRMLSCIMHGKTIEEASVNMDKFRVLVEDHRFMGPDGKSNNKLTVSIGIHYVSGKKVVVDPKDIFKIAIGYIHRADAEGGNRIFKE